MNFLDFAAEHGLLIDNLIEGQWARVKTSDKPKKRNGSYKFLGDVGFVQNFATMDRVAVWRPDGRVERVDKAALRKMMADNARRERERQEAARATAEMMIRQAVTGGHPYLERKGFPQETGLVLSGRFLICEGTPDEKEVVLEGDLLVPMRSFALYKQVNSIQHIAAGGSKLFLPYGKAQGSVFFIGPFMARERWLVEGLATGLSLRAALKKLYREAQIVVCFSSGNLAHVGALVKPLAIPAFVMADHDKPNPQTGKRAGEEAAKFTGLPWVRAPEEETDANDLHQRHGLGALVDLIRSLRREVQAA